jgi:pimeloyl-ACP methyl ester carboxylesterase
VAAAKQRRVRAGGIEINVRESGGEGRPILLLTGIGCNVEHFAPFQDSFGGRRTIALDAPGTGWSDAPFRPMTIGNYADVAADVLQTLGHESVDVVGYSFGGTVAQQLARDHPSLVRRLVLVATTCGWGGIPGDALAVGAVTTPLRFYSRRVHDLTQRLMGQGHTSEDPSIIEQQRQARAAAPPSLHGYWIQGVAFSTWSSWPWLPSLDHETLVMVGERDRLIPPVNGEILAARLAHARLVVVPREGHHFLGDPAIQQVKDIPEFLSIADVEESRAWRDGTELADLEGIVLPVSRNPVAWPLLAASTVWRSVFA